MYSDNILNFQESATILNAGTKKVWKLIEGTPYLHGKDTTILNMYNKVFGLPVE